MYYSYRSWYLIWQVILGELLERKVTLCMHALVTERSWYLIWQGIFGELLERKVTFCMHALVTERSWYLIWQGIFGELLERKVTLCMHALVTERQMKRYCSKTEVFKHCEIDSGFCMNRTHPVEFVAKTLRESFAVPDSFQNGISYLALGLSRVPQRPDKLVKWIPGYSRHSNYNPWRCIRIVILHVWLAQDICKAFSLLCF